MSGVVFNDLILLPSMGKLHYKTVFPPGVNVAAAAPSFTATEHTIQERAFSFPSISVKTWPSLTQWLWPRRWAVLIGLSKCAVGQISFSGGIYASVLFVVQIGPSLPACLDYSSIGLFFFLRSFLQPLGTTFSPTPKAHSCIPTHPLRCNVEMNSHVRTQTNGT